MAGEKNEQSIYNHLNVLPLMIYAAFIMFDKRVQYKKKMQILRMNYESLQINVAGINTVLKNSLQVL